LEIENKKIESLTNEINQKIEDLSAVKSAIDDLKEKEKMLIKEKSEQNDKLLEYNKNYEEEQNAISELKKDKIQLENKGKILSNEVDNTDNQINDVKRKIRD